MQANGLLWKTNYQVKLMEFLSPVEGPVQDSTGVLVPARSDSGLGQTVV